MASLAIGAASCSSSPSASPPSPAVKAMCDEVKRVVNVKPDELLAYPSTVAKNAQNSGDPTIDAAAKVAYADKDAGAVKQANTKIKTACKRLGIW